MSRLGDGGLPDAPRSFELRLVKSGFETADKALEDDLDRAKRLVRAKDHPAIEEWHALDLAARLRDRAASSPASRVFSRRHRLNVAYALYRQRQLPGAPESKFVTLMPAMYNLPANLLPHITPSAYLGDRLRKQIERQVPERSPGYLYGFFDIEYAPGPPHWRIAPHMIVSGSYLDAINRLRRLPWMTSPGVFPNFCEARRPVRIDRIKPESELKVLTYVTKSAWFQQDVVIDGKRCRGPKRAIPDPFHSQLLLWLDHFQMRDLTLRMGLSITREGFRMAR